MLQRLLEEYFADTTLIDSRDCAAFFESHLEMPQLRCWLICLRRTVQLSVPLISKCCLQELKHCPATTLPTLVLFNPDQPDIGKL